MHSVLEKDDGNPVGALAKFSRIVHGILQVKIPLESQIPREVLNHGRCARRCACRGAWRAAAEAGSGHVPASSGSGRGGGARWPGVRHTGCPADRVLLTWLRRQHCRYHSTANLRRAHQCHHQRGTNACSSTTGLPTWYHSTADRRRV